MAIALLLGWQAKNLEFDYEFERLFPVDDPDLVFYQKFSEKFGNDNDYLLIGIENKAGLFELDFLQKVELLTRQLKNTPEVERVVSPTASKKIISTPLGLVDIPILHLDDPSRLSRDSISIFSDPQLSQTFYSKNKKGMRLMLFHERIDDPTRSAQFTLHLDSLVESNHFDETHIAGKAKAQHVYVNLVKKDFIRFLIISAVIIAILLTLFMRHPAYIVSTFMVAILTIVSTLGIMTLLGKKIDLISSLLPTILVVVAMSNIIHLFFMMKSKLAEGGSFPQKFWSAIKEIGFATFLTSLTTALGFVTLILIRVAPLAELGLFAAVGIALAFLMTYLIFPAAVSLMQRKHALEKLPKDSHNNPFLSQIYRTVLRRRKSIFGTFGMFALIFVLGISIIDINAYLIDDLPNDSPLKKDFAYFDEQYGGVRPWMMSISVVDENQSVYSKNVIREIDKVEQAVKQHVQVSGLLSPVSYVKAANQIYHNGSSSYYQLPEKKKDWKRTLNFIKRQKPEQRYIKVSEGADARLFGFTPDIGSKQSLLNDRSLENELHSIVDTNVLQFKITGTSQLIDKSHASLSAKLILGLLVAMGMVGIIAGLLFKSWRMVLITLIPNLFPILATAAVMGFFGIPIKLSTSIIFAISFGIVVDDTIHFLSKFRHEKSMGLSNIYALKRTILTTGKPILITTLILTCGFGAFCFSSFAVTFHIGLFVAISFLVALIADLFLLPALILLVYKN